MSFDALASGWAKTLGLDKKQFNMFFGKMMDGFAYHKIVTDEAGKPVDYVFLEVNSTFEQMTGLKKEKIIGKRVSEVLPGIERDPADWIGVYGRVALTGEPTQFENFAAALDKWYRVSAYCPEKGYFVALFEDITDSKKAQEEIVRLASFPALNPNAVVEVDLECSILYANPASEKTFPELKGAGCGHAFFSGWEGVVKTLQEGSKSFGRELKIGDHWYYQYFSPALQDQRVRIYATTIDELKAAEEALRGSEQRWATTLSSIGDAVIATDMAGNVNFMNPVAERLTGWTLAEVAGKPIKGVFNIVNEQTRREVESPVDRVLREGLVVGLANHTVLIRKDGAEVPIDDSGAPIKGKEGNITGVVLVFRDITERKKSEEKIAQQAFMLANVNDSIIGYNTELKVTFWNKGAEQLYGYTEQEAMGKASLELLKPTYSEVTREELIRRLQTDGHAEAESIRRNKKGEARIVEAHIIQLRSETGKPMGYVSVDRDITERRKAEEELRESEQRLNRSQEIAHLGSWELDIVNNKLTWSDEVYRIFGLKPQEFGATYEAFLSYVHPDDRQKVDDAYLGSIKTGKDNYEVEHRVVRKDTGEERIVHEKCEHMRDASGKIIRSVGMVHDITERKNAEEAILKARAQAEFDRKRLETILETTPSAVVIIDASDGKFSFVNKRAMELYGFDTLGLDLNENVAKVKARRSDGTDYPVEEMPVSRSLRFGQVVHNEEMIIQNAKGKSFPIIASTAPLRDLHGNIIAAIVVWEDITERKKIEEALKQSEVKFRTVADFTYDWEYWISPSGDLVHISPSCERITGYKADEFVNNPKLLTEIVHPEDKKLVNVHFDIVSSKELHDVDFRIVTRTGGIRWISHACQAVYDNEGKWLGRRASNRDITERKKAEEALKKSEEEYRSLFTNMKDGFAFCKMLFDEQGKPVDFMYLQINDAFESITGLKREQVIGRKVTEAIPGTEKTHPELIATYGRVAQTGKEEKFEIDFKPLNLCLAVSAYSPQIGYFAAVFEDITQRKKAERELWQAKNDWERTFDSVPDFIAILDKNHKIVRVNKAMATQLGVTPDQAIGLRCYQCVHGTSLPPEFCPHAKTVKDGKQHVEEVHEPRLGGDFLVSTTPIRDEQGNMVGSVHVARNITDRKRAEDNLRRLNRTLRAISNSNQALMRATDETEFLQEGCRILVDDCGYKMVWVGYARDDKAKSVEPVAYAGFDENYLNSLRITWADTERGQGPTGTAIRTGIPQLCESIETDKRMKPWRDEALKRGYASTVVLPLKAGGKTFGAITMYSKENGACTEDEIKLLTELANDFSYGITTLRLSKETKEAHKTVQKQASLIDLSPDAIIVREPEGKITFWSKGAEKLYGYAKEEALGQSSNSILKTIFPESLKAILKEVKQKGHWTGELIHQTKEGKKLTVQSYWQPTFDENGVVVELMESNVDVTDRKQMQTKLEEYAAHLEELVQERTQQLKDAERLTAIGETAGMVGHDLRNPLQTVTGETYLAKAEIDALPESEAKNNLQESINTIADQISYMDKIVSDLQDFVRPITPDKKPVNIGNLLTATVAEVKVPENIDVETKINQNLPEIQADAQLLKRVFINLVTNAVQAMPHGGRLAVRTEQHKKTKANPNGKLFIHVQDTGEGIPESAKPKLFKPLFTTKSKGQGFGLSVCKRVIEAHGGTITFTSHPGVGTTFTVELPT